MKELFLISLTFTSKTSASNHPERVRQEGEGADEEVEAAEEEDQFHTNLETRFRFHICKSLAGNFHTEDFANFL